MSTKSPVSSVVIYKMLTDQTLNVNVKWMFIYVNLFKHILLSNDGHKNNTLFVNPVFKRTSICSIFDLNYGGHDKSSHLSP